MRKLQEQVKKHSVTENCSSVREKVLKFEAESQEFAKLLRKKYWDLETCRKS